MDFSEIQRLLDEGKVLEMPWNGFILKDSNSKYRQLSISKEQDSFQVWLYGAELPKETHWVKEAKNPEVLKTLLSIKDLEF